MYRYTSFYCTSLYCTSQTLHCFYKLKERLSTSKKFMTWFIVTFTLLQYSGSEPTISLRYACTFFQICWGSIYGQDFRGATATIRLDSWTTPPQNSSNIPFTLCEWALLCCILSCWMSLWYHSRHYMYICFQNVLCLSVIKVVSTKT